MAEERTYSIGEVSKITGLSIPTLRFYDKEGLFPDLGRLPSGTRRFTVRDLNSIRLIECLKKTGMQLIDIKAFIRWTRQGSSTIQKRLEMFIEREKAIREEIVQLEDALDLIKFKKWYYTKADELGSTDAVDAISPDKMPDEIRELYLKTHPAPPAPEDL